MQPNNASPVFDSILAEAAAVVDGPRRADYGTPAENHGRTAALWSAYLGVPIAARDVCMLNVLQKVSRDRHGVKRDNLVDIAGYARNAELCEPSPTPAPRAPERTTPRARAIATAPWECRHRRAQASPCGGWNQSGSVLCWKCGGAFDDQVHHAENCNCARCR